MMFEQDPFSGRLFLFRGKRADRLKLLYHNENGLCLFAKSLGQGRSTWPGTADAPGGVVTFTPAQLSMLLEGLKWRAPVRSRVPASAG